MTNVTEWIKTAVIVLGFLLTIGTFSYQSCATRNDIERLDNKIDRVTNEARTDRTRIESQLINHLYRIEDKVEQLNQNYIEHLAHHNKKD